MAESVLDPYLAKILEHVTKNPIDEEVIVTELNSLINKFDPEIRSGACQPLPLVSPEFKPNVKNVREKIWTVLGRKMKIPDLRYEADRLSRELGILLPNSTRKNNEALMHWFETHWTLIAPRLRGFPHVSDGGAQGQVNMA